MSRIKHIVMILFKVFFIVLCFLVATSYSAIKSADLSALEGMKNKVDLEGCEVLVFSSGFEESGASVTYEVKDGKIIFDITQSGLVYDDVAVSISFPEYTYDATEMREYLNDVLGKKAKREEGYLKAMEEGPWRANYSFKLTGEGVDGKKYTVTDSSETEYVQMIVADGSATGIEDVYLMNGEEYDVMLTFGAEYGGALPSGRYVFESELEVVGLYESNEKISFASTVEIITKICADGIKAKGFGIFDIENFLVFYGAMVVTGMFVYSWRDLRSMIKIFCAVCDSMGDGVWVIVNTYVNGTYTGSYETVRGGPSLLVAFFVTVLCYMVFLLSIPIRMVIFLVRDIVYLFKEDDELEGFPFLGNIIGSVGIYVLLFGVVALLGASYLIGAIGTVVGLAMCITAAILCRRHEEEYA